MAAAVLGAGSLALAPGATIASTSIAITTGGCSGGGTQYCYSPENAAATSGSPVTWTNSSGVAHTITKCTASACPGAPTSTGADSFNVDVSGSSGSFTFSGAGTYVYYCTVHGYAAMHGTVT